MRQGRIKIIDIAKGISIVLVAFSHSRLGLYVSDVNDVLSLFRLPLFFFLSGIFFDENKKKLFFVFDKTDALLKPYFVTLFLLLILRIIFFDYTNYFDAIKGIVYGNANTLRPRWAALWFLTHLWAVYMFAYAVFNSFKLNYRPIYIKVAIILSIFILGVTNVELFWGFEFVYQNNKYIVNGLPFSVDIIFVTFSYFASGRVFRDSIVEYLPDNRYFVLSLILFVYCIMNGAAIDLNNRVYYKPLFSALASISGIYMVLFLSYYIRRNVFFSKILCAAGEASLFILLFHMFVERVSYKLIVGDIITQNIYVSISTFTICLILPVIIKSIVNYSDFLKLFYFPLKNNKYLLRFNSFRAFLNSMK